MWNYRLCKKTHRTAVKDPEEIICVSYEIHEAFYNKDGGIWAVTEEPVTVGAYIELVEESEAEKLTELGLTLDQMRIALHKGIIDLDTFEFADHDSEDDEDFDDDDEFLATDDEFIELNTEDPKDN